MTKLNLKARTAATLLVASTVLGAGLARAAADPTTEHLSGAVAAHGTVSVLFAGSLVNYMERYFGPSFQKAAGYGFRGFGGGSTELASEIRGRVRSGDVFVSAAAAADRSLEGSANGAWVSWYSAFMSSPLELAYNPNGRVGGELRSGVPWYRVLEQSGIRVGRTDPKLDPKGVLTVEAVNNASKKLHDKRLERALTSVEVFPETGLVGRLQSGQLDAGFLYAVEAKNAKLPTVSLAPVYKYAAYTLTILNRAPNPTGAAALIRYLLNAARGYTLRKNGLTPVRPQFSGRSSAVPTGLRSLVGAR
ncbi:MAG: bacterial extracellular solute-binding family protein [Solirubrobacterales bacterium]|nr:bacterial extracellular solute-binding family protein [Solirubrobacterales bacterium]